MQEEINYGCSEEFSELCALSTSNSLSAREDEQLEAHVAVCAQCALLLNQYRMLASAGMAKIAATGARDLSESSERLPSADHLKAKLVAALAPVQTAHSFARRRATFSWQMPAWRFSAGAAVAAGILITVASGYLVGSAHRSRQSRSLIALSAETEATLKVQLAEAQSQLTLAKEQLDSVSARNASLQLRSEQAVKDVHELENVKGALESKIQALASDSQRQTTVVADLASQRESLMKKLADSENLLQSARQELKSVQDDHQRVVLRAASLESQVDRLSVELHERDETARRSQQYLASDRDVRELMGARQLYIADVFDVDSQGETKKPFGRVFYTKGKSLIFYAFDLDRQPGYKEAKAFQAWGRPGSSHATPVSLGIFYLDNEKNRRWALKFEDPKVLEEINALFVTLEPKGGSKQPTNKPFLLAYLHTTTANHP
jgi:Anti-sigma-K factor rskA